MSTFYRHFLVTDEGGDKLDFKHYPDDAGKIIVAEDKIDSTLGARIHMNKLIHIISLYMSDNTICKVEVEEGEE